MTPTQAVPGPAAGAKDEPCPPSDPAAVFARFFAVLRRCEAALAPVTPAPLRPRAARRPSRRCEARAAS